MMEEDRTETGNKRGGGGDSTVSLCTVDNKLDIVISQLNNMKSDIDSLRSEQKNLTESLNYCHQLVNDNSGKINCLDKKVNDGLSDIETLRTANVQLTKAFKQVSAELADLQQYTRKNCLNIHGIPKGNDENLLNIIGKIATCIGFPLHKDMIGNCHRLPSRNGDNNAPIIVKFVKYTDKDNFLILKRAKGKITLSGTGLGSSNSVVYINESMSPKNSLIFKKAKSLQKENKLKFVWFRNGRVFIKYNENTEPMVITDINNF
ncbi:hypothetical protein RI129_007077 [Pyrocoelia pectoralis]|uniref:FP protein C-terminal domain-containing protein n=1 Tax=Pyrocoelia pectoralis TaxID=417401 RepID=A0AAN7ZGS1_9COLE